MTGFEISAHAEGVAARLAYYEGKPGGVPANPYGRNGENARARAWDRGFATAWAHKDDDSAADVAARHRQACLDGKNGAAYLVFYATRDLAAWSIGAFPSAHVVGRVVNQYGTRYRFADGTALFVTRGAPRRQRVYDAEGFGVAARPA